MSEPNETDRVDSVNVTVNGAEDRTVRPRRDVGCPERATVPVGVGVEKTQGFYLEISGNEELTVRPRRRVKGAATDAGSTRGLEGPAGQTSPHGTGGHG